MLLGLRAPTAAVLLLCCGAAAVLRCCCTVVSPPPPPPPLYYQAPSDSRRRVTHSSQPTSESTPPPPPPPRCHNTEGDLLHLLQVLWSSVSPEVRLQGDNMQPVQRVNKDSVRKVRRVQLLCVSQRKRTSGNFRELRTSAKYLLNGDDEELWLHITHTLGCVVVMLPACTVCWMMLTSFVSRLALTLNGTKCNFSLVPAVPSETLRESHECRQWGGKT